jgi:hypothetical protein
MENSSAIELIKQMLPEKVSYANLIGASSCYGDKYVYEDPEPYALELAIRALEENDKLKDEINQLKVELEQSVKLPCKVGDYVFIAGKCENFPKRLDGGYWDATGYYCPFEESALCPFNDLDDFDDCNTVKERVAIFEDIITGVHIETESIYLIFENGRGKDLSEFGKTVFLTREKAEQALKGVQSVKE